MTFSTLTRCSLGLLALALTSGVAHAQTPTWTSAQSFRNTEANRYALGVAADGSQYVTGTFTGTLVLGGTSLTAGAGAGHVFLAKYSAGGVVVWAKQLDSPGTLSSKLAVDAAGNVYLAGTFTTTLTAGTTTLSASGTSAEPYLLKYDAQGVAQWARPGGGPGGVNGIAIGPNGDVALVGVFSAALNFGGSVLAGGGAYCYRFSPTGNVLQAVPFGQNISPEAVALDPAGNTYLTGEFSGNVTVGSVPLSAINSGAFYKSDIFLCKVDGSGTVLWAVRDGSSGDDLANALVVDAGGNPVIGGKLYDTVMPQGPGGVSSTTAPYLARYTSQGGSIWRRVMEVNSGPGGIINAVAHDSRGGYLVTGYLYGSTSLSTANLYSFGTAFVIRFDSQNSVNWYAETATGLPSSNYPSISGQSIAANASGKVFLAGDITHGTPSFGGLPSIGLGFFIATLQPGAVLSTHSILAIGSLDAYPNPTTGSVTLALPTGGGHLIVRDALGRTVREQELPASSEHVLSLTGMAPGIYHLQVTFTNGQIARRQLAVQ